MTSLIVDCLKFVACDQEANLHILKLFSAAIVLLAWAKIVSAEPQQSPLRDERAVFIETSGSVPGYSNAQLNNVLAKKLNAVAGKPWHFFATAESSSLPAPNRIIWSFKTLKHVWPGGSHSGFPSPTFIQTYVSAEAKLYLDGAYQMTVASEPTFSSSNKEEGLEKIADTLSKALLNLNDR